MTTGGQRIAAGIVVAMFLVILADFPQTAPLAVAFSYLILLSTLLLVGPAALTKLQVLTGTIGPSGSSTGSDTT